MVLFIVFICGCTSKERASKDNLEIITNSSKIKVWVETARTPKELQQGLMFRESLDDYSGMLFIFKKEDRLSFWMKNTKIPLDIIFISENWTINEIKSNVQPCQEDPCPTYPSKYPIMYVLEVNAGFSERNGIKVGDKVNLNTIKD